jgi:hypothetical protein
MNRDYQNSLFAESRTSFSERSLGKGVCYYAILLVATSWISWVPTVVACEKFYPHNDRKNGWAGCRIARLKECNRNDTTCIKKVNCEDCKCGAINMTWSNNNRRPWVIDDYARACPATPEKNYVNDLENLYREYMKW